MFNVLLPAIHRYVSRLKQVVKLLEEDLMVGRLCVA